MQINSNETLGINKIDEGEMNPETSDPWTRKKCPRGTTPPVDTRIGHWANGSHLDYVILWLIVASTGNRFL